MMNIKLLEVTVKRSMLTWSAVLQQSLPDSTSSIVTWCYIEKHRFYDIDFDVKSTISELWMSSPLWNSH